MILHELVVTHLCSIGAKEAVHAPPECPPPRRALWEEWLICFLRPLVAYTGGFALQINASVLAGM